MRKKTQKSIRIMILLLLISLFLFVSNFNVFKNIVYATDEVNPSNTYTQENIDNYLTNENGKLAFWKNDDKTKADIVISYKQELNDGIYLATLCNAHNLKLDYLSDEITAAASIADINLYLEGKDLFGATFPNGGAVYQGTNRITDQRAFKKIEKGTLFNVNAANLINTAEGPTKEQYVRFGKKVDIGTDNSLFITSSGEHANVRTFADDIVDALGSGEYNPEFIIISFDAWVWACQAESLENNDDALKMLQAAKLLEKYYKEKRVIWLTSEDMISEGKIKTAKDIEDLGTGVSRASWTKYLYPDNLEDFYNPPVGTTLFESDEFKNDEEFANCRNTDGTYNNQKYVKIDAYLKYIISHHEQTSPEWVRGTLRNRTGNEDDVIRGLEETKDYFLMSKKAPFYQWAILDPEKYITVVDNSGNPTSIPNIEDWNTDVLTIAYSDADSVSEAIHDHLTGYNTYLITDTLADGLVYDTTLGAEVYFYDEQEEKWMKITDGFTVEQDQNNIQKINIKITNEEAINKRIRAIIHTKCDENEFCENDGSPKDTNKGNAKVTTYYNEKERITTSYISPKLKKVCPNLSIEKSVSPVNAKAGDIINYTIKVRNTGHEDAINTTISDKLPSELIYQESNPEGTLNEDIITWINKKVPAPTYENGVIVNEGFITISLKAQIKEDVETKTFTNIAYAFDQRDPEHPNKEKAVLASADVIIEQKNEENSSEPETNDEQKITEETKDVKEGNNIEDKINENKGIKEESKDETKLILPKTGKDRLTLLILAFVALIALVIFGAIIYRKKKNL